MAQRKFLDLAGLSKYDELLKIKMAEDDAKVQSEAAKYADSLASNYDAAGTAETKVNELANGAVKANTEAIAKLNGSASTEGSVAKAVEDAKTALNETIAGVEAKADAAQAAADKAQGEVDLVEIDLGDVDNLSTENKTVVGAINEVLAAVGAGGTAATVTLTSDNTTEGMLKSYTLKQGSTTVGVIDIPKDMVVESGSVVVDPEGQAAGTYIKLVLANVAEPLYINVGTLVDLYTAKAEAAQVQIAIDAQTREISASIVAGSITSVELADNSIVTAKIADANVTKAKLSSAVQASLDKADASATKAEFDAEVARATAAEAKALTDAKSYADGIVSDERTVRVAAEAQVLADAKAYTNEKDTAMNTRVLALEGLLGSGEGSVADQIADALAEAKGYTDTKNTAMDGRMVEVENALEGVGDSTVVALIDAAKGAANTYTDGEIDKVEVLVGNNTTAINGHADRLTALESKVGDGCAAIEIASIENLFI